ncbi:hypothetical protein CHIBA101_0483 [Actinomyces sp. Chiba101]|uniref:Uncharacterized protein n=1 Tax=Actinomyces denticolens TaxID=52767 RepID=A0ABY1I2L6_9ACTO|nr:MULTISPECIES: hypothetical protein [Actinomyces]BAW92350.1 hypothetical protein CHIBA101_0483 [Actinomyces sp. Chiba101]GAV94708.1 hypothetical protein ADENT20671_1478 [Actinomyces denticolens]SHI50939.1 hypothetical protein SAMN05216246_102310 [Actinomyces denticolens]SUU09676.1 Uncharacterised protein [Actinomyces denticolens]
MIRIHRPDLSSSISTILDSRAPEGMRDWIQRSAQPSSESLEHVEARLLALRGALAKTGASLSSDIEKDAALVHAARRQGHLIDLVIGRERAPYNGEAGFLSWIEHNGSVLLTTAPVRELYEEVARW